MKSVINPYAQKKKASVAPKSLHEPLLNFSSLQTKEAPREQKGSSTFEKQTELPSYPESFGDNSTANDLPIWQRLPSKNLSFGSAEVLTIPECSEHIHDFEDKSVRIVGLVLAKHLHEDGTVSLVVGDPLALLHQSGTRSETNENDTQLEDNADVEMKPGSRDSPGHKRPRLDDWTTLLHDKDTSSVWVVTNPAYVPHQVGINDLVSVIGEVRRAKAADAPSKFHLHARICRNANGTNMVLFTDALMARRQFLRKTLPALTVGLGPSKK